MFCRRVIGSLGGFVFGPSHRWVVWSLGRLVIGSFVRRVGAIVGSFVHSVVGIVGLSGRVGAGSLGVIGSFAREICWIVVGVVSEVVGRAIYMPCGKSSRSP